MVARDLDEDPERLSLACLSMLRYAEAHAALKAAGDAKNPAQAMEPWKRSTTMDTVKVNEMKLSAERRARQKPKGKP